MRPWSGSFGILHVKGSKMLGGNRDIDGGQMDSRALRVLIWNLH